jgi:hypothetical protein
MKGHVGWTVFMHSNAVVNTTHYILIREQVPRQQTLTGYQTTTGNYTPTGF